MTPESTWTKNARVRAGDDEFYAPNAEAYGATWGEAIIEAERRLTERIGEDSGLSLYWRLTDFASGLDVVLDPDETLNIVAEVSRNA